MKIEVLEFSIYRIKGELDDLKKGREKLSKKLYLERKREHVQGMTCQLSKSHGPCF